MRASGFRPPSISGTEGEIRVPAGLFVSVFGLARGRFEGQLSPFRSLDAIAAAAASSGYVVRGQKKPLRPSLRLRGTTWTCRWGTLWLIRLFMATNDPVAPRTVSIA